MTVDPNLLGAFPILSQFDSRSLGALSAVFEHRAYEHGALIVEQGSRRGGLFLLVSGWVKVERRLPDGSTVDLMTIGPGALFGVLSVLDGGERGATCVAQGTVECAELPRSEARDLVNGRTPLALRFQLAVIREVFSDLRRTNQRLASLATMPDDQLTAQIIHQAVRSVR